MRKNPPTLQMSLGKGDVLLPIVGRHRVSPYGDDIDRSDRMARSACGIFSGGAGHPFHPFPVDDKNLIA